MKQAHDQQPGSNTARSLFERTTFQDFQQKMRETGEFKVDNYPEMIKIKEEAIRFREAEEQKRLQKMVKAKQLSPRTYDRKVRDLETWVTKEKEEVKKTRKAHEEQSSKSAQLMIEQTQKNQESVKKMLPSSEHNIHNQLHQHAHKERERTYDSLPSENTMNHPISHRLSTRREDSTRLLDMIDDYKNADAAAEDPYGSQPPTQSLHAQLQQQLHQRDQERLQQELERKKEIEMLKEQVRQQKLREEEAEAQRRAEEEQEREKQRKIREEQDRVAREAEKKRMLEAQAERERQRKAQEERDKLLQE